MRTPALRARGDSAYASARGLKLHYLRYGGLGDPLVIIPGITSPAITWDAFASELSASCPVIVLGVSGRGLSERPPAGYRLADYAAEFAAFLDAVGLQRPMVVGHSMGARIAAACATAYERHRGPLILIEPPLSGPGRPAYPTTLSQLLDSIRASRDGTALELFRRTNPAWSDEQIRLRAEWLATCDERAVAESHRGFHDDEFFDYWPKLAAPVLFVYGTQSPVVTEKDLAELAKTNPAAEFAAVSSAGHMIPWDNQDGLLQVIRSFIQNQRRSREKG